MANTKISALTSATTPLAGTEVLPIVQSSATVKVATNDLTVRNIRANATTGILQVTGPAAASTRVATVPDANFTVARTDAAQSFTGDQTLSTGNLVIGTSGKGVDFSATPGTGTSELFADYEEGVFTATLTCTSGTITLNSTQDQMQYTKIGRVVYISGQIGVSSVSSPSGSLKLASLPFTTSNSLGELAGRGAGAVVADTVSITINNVVLTFLANNTVMTIEKYAAGVQANMAADVSAGSSFWISAWYVAA
jgi:hypothetical protein